MSPTSINSASALLVALADSAARSTLLGCVVALSLATVRVKNVHAKLFAWKGLLLVALAMPALVLISPPLRVLLPAPTPGPAASVRPLTEPDVTQATPVVPLGPEESAVIAGQPRVYASPETPVGAGEFAPVAPLPAPRWHEIPWTLIAFSVYAAVALALLARILVGVAFGNRLVRTATLVDEPRALELLSRASLAARLRSLPRLAESEMLSVPIMIGVRKPTILLPADGRVWEADDLAAVLLHEASHVARRDALSQRLALIHRAIFWFSPLAWWLERHLADLAEQASDEAALAGGVDRTRYAESLLGFFADLEALPERVWWQGVSMAKAGQAEKRVDRILAWRNGMSNQWKKSLAVALVALAAPLVALTAAVRPASYDVQAPSAPPAPSVPAEAPAAAAAPADPQLSAPQEVRPIPAAPNADGDSGDADVRVTPALPPFAPLPRVRVYVPPVNVDVPAVDVNVPSLHVQIPAVHVAVPEMHIETPWLPSQGPVILSANGDWNFQSGWGGGYFLGRYEDGGPRFAIVTKDSEALMMAGDRADAEHARALKAKYSGDFIWFEHDEKSYVIDDPATVDRVKKLWQPELDLEKQQRDLRKQQEDLARQQEDAAKNMESMKIKVPDLTAEMQKLEQVMKQLSADGGTMNDLGDLQREIGDLQSRIGELEMRAGSEQGQFGREQGAWGRKMGELGRQQGELGRKQAQESREAARQMQQLLDDAVTKGLAKPE